MTDNMDLNKGGVKHDADKPPIDLIAPELIFGVAEVLAFGANKYTRRNWEKGMRWGRVFGALMRHSWSWFRGEACDPETGLPHTWHMGCCVMFLIAYEARGSGTDDRPILNADGIPYMDDDEPAPAVAAETSPAKLTGTRMVDDPYWRRGARLRRYLDTGDEPESQ